MNTIESTLRQFAFELGLSVEELRARVDEHCGDADHGDWLRSLYTTYYAVGGPVESPSSVMARWLQARGYTTAIGDVARWQTEREGSHWRVRQDVYDRVGILEAPPAIVLLWALAVELDEDAATFTGERLCRDCGGRRQLIEDLDVGSVPSPAFVRRCTWRGFAKIREWKAREKRPLVRMHRVDGVTVNRPVQDTRIVLGRCHCTAPTRPETVSLEWLVRRLAAVGDFRAVIAGWPAAWQAQLDSWQATGETHWRAQWWFAFAEWAHAGKQPDLHRLSRLLDVRMAL